MHPPRERMQKCGICVSFKCAYLLENCGKTAVDFPQADNNDKAFICKPLVRQIYDTLVSIVYDFNYGDKGRYELTHIVDKFQLYLYTRVFSVSKMRWNFYPKSDTVMRESWTF